MQSILGHISHEFHMCGSHKGQVAPALDSAGLEYLKATC